MTYRYTDPDGDTFEADACMNDDGTPVIVIDCITARIPLARVEELVAGIRDTARQAAGQQPAEHVHRLGNPDDDGGILDDWDNCRDPDCPGPANTCTCADAGACFAPAGHYADCPAAA